ncbi:MAG: hypothetical protein AB8H80_04405 [Planctomycetota bacterium]
MDQVPTEEEMRALIAPLDDLDRKVLGGVVAVWMAEPGRLRDREWTAQHFVQIATVAHGFEPAASEEGAGASATTEDVERIRGYAVERMEPILRIGFPLFVRVAQDMQQREGGFSFEDAQQQVAAYLAG